MKLSANLSTMFREYPLIDRFAAARKAGFDAVEVQFPYELPTEDISRALADAGQRLVLINTPPGNMEAGERGLASLPGRETEFQDAIGLTAQYAEALGVPFVHLMGGAPPAGADRAECRAVLEANLRYACDRLKRVGAMPLLEPLNHHDNPGFFIPTSRQCVEVIQAVGHENLGLQFDLYHSFVMGEDPAEEIRKYFPHIRHVQFSDAPGRHQPGTGNIDFLAAFNALTSRGYAGLVGAEYIPTAATVDSLGWKAEYEALGTPG